MTDASDLHGQRARGFTCPPAGAGTFGRISNPWVVVALVALALVAPVLAGCGSGEGEGGPTSGSGDQQALYRSALTAKADAICATYRSKFLDTIKLPSDLTDLTSVGAYAAASHDLFQRRHAELTALKPDDTTRSQWDAFLAADQGNVDVVGRLETAAKTKVVANIARVTGESQVVLKKAVAAADAVGATGCGSGPG